MLAGSLVIIHQVCLQHYDKGKNIFWNRSLISTALDIHDDMGKFSNSFI